MARSDDPSNAARGVHVQNTAGSSSHAAAPNNTEKEERHRYVGNYEILKTIGEGSFAKVKLGVHRLTGEKVAIKVIDKDRLPDAYSLRHVHREARIMRLLDHPNIVQLYEVMETKREVMLVLEYAGGGEVLDYIVAHGRLREPEAKRFIVMILDALIHCHSMNVVHRDLKAENLLLSAENTIKISDFGLSNIFDPTKTLTTCCGSPVYSAPELIEGKRYVGPEVDSWSLGVNLYAMVVGDLPFADNNLSGLYDAILKGRYELPEYLSPECRDLITKLLIVNPKKRYTCVQARDHPWLAAIPITAGRRMSNARMSIGPSPPAVPPAHSARPHIAEDVDLEVLDRLENYGFDRTAAMTSILESRFDAAAGTYFLLKRKKNFDPESFAKESTILMRNSVQVSQSNKAGHAGGLLAEAVETNGIPSGIVKMSPVPGSTAADTTSEALAKVLISVERTRRMSVQGASTSVPASMAPPPVKEKVRAKGDKGSEGDEESKARGRPVSKQRRGARNASEPVGGVGGGKDVGSGILWSGGDGAGKAAEPKNIPPFMNGRRASYQPDMDIEGLPSGGAMGKTWTSGEHLREKPSHHNSRDATKLNSLARPKTLFPPIPQPTSSDDSNPGQLRAGNAGGMLELNKLGSAPATTHTTAQSATTASPSDPSQHQHKFKRARSRTIAIDESLYLSRELPTSDPSLQSSTTSSSDPLGSPRTIRFAFNCSTTTTLSAPALFDRLRRALDRNGIDYLSEGYLCDCEAPPPPGGIVGPSGCVRFEAEVCKLPGLKMCGLRLRRVGGDMWEYKRLCGTITQDLDL
ncbi:MAP microtubule affinity-regulating kinase 1 [Rhizophlyctis rosea]|nr:MAP microtubule affinity-regulating kinase 1 [Rhizophlyctis rosea]